MPKKKQSTRRKTKANTSENDLSQTSQRNDQRRQQTPDGDPVPSRGRFFFGIFLVLVALTLASFAVGNLELFASKQSKWIVMIGISVAKASIVILFFMHLWWEKSWKYLLTIPTTIMAIVLVVALIPDILQRRNYYSENRINNSAEPGAYTNDQTIGNE